jgi:hypothetical protein
MKRKILLIEPNFKNKYPPIGLMKIATYHRQLGDEVVFFKGEFNDFVLAQIVEECIAKLEEIENNINWKIISSKLKLFFKKKDAKLLELSQVVHSPNLPLIAKWLEFYRTFYRNKEYFNTPRWDRVYVATLFTFYWNITIKTIEFVKPLVKNPQTDIKIGGVMASLLYQEIIDATGITPMKGLLDKVGVLDKGNKIVIDDLPLDYSILYEIDYEYPTQSAYFTFMTKGCTRKCKFCSVPILEPTYKERIETKDKFNCITDIYGEQHNLMLMDNNVLASPKFPEIVQEIKEMGFYKGSTYVEPNQLDIAITNLEIGLNDKAYIRRSQKLLIEQFSRLKNKPEISQFFYNILEKYHLLDIDGATKENILAAYPHLKDIYETSRNKASKQRHVDFNQGTDCRYVNDEMMKLISEIPIRPLRIAFDYWGLRPKYEEAVRLAAKYGLKDLSNYILYNFTDTPDEFWLRIKLNIDLCLELDIQIYSFPMKFIPLFGEEAKHREHIGKHWNRKFIRAVQSVLNVSKGIVAPAKSNEKGKTFFEKAFGSNLSEFHEILYMPETYIIYRKVFEELGYTQEWKSIFTTLQPSELAEAKSIIEKNDFSNIDTKTKNPKIVQLLQHYTITRGNIRKDDTELKKLRLTFDKLIKKDKAIERTLTYDFE